MADTVPCMDELPDARERLARARVLYTDLDGTLLGRGACLLCDGRGGPTLDAVTAVAQLNRAGLRVVVTSGRNAKQLMEVSRLLGWRDFIGELGTVRSYERGARTVYDTGDWPDDAVARGSTPYAAIADAGAMALLTRRFPGLIEYHDPWHHDREVTHMLRGDLPLLDAQAALDGLALPITLVDNGIIHPPTHTLIGVDEIHAYHLVPTGASKQRAIAHDLAEHGLSRDDALAIGDSAADVEMADSVGLMAVVRNGLDDPALIAHATGRAGMVATRGSFGAGWREFVEAWLAARAGSA